ncbi:hypothetical protein MSG28_009189 [Choristoneura fumiferana]|uniref:Uncharacterized protein n=1 Tax=Choristoneura fumiferana TaxID=7141 RepID=A0ACC0KX41_CHOFU|nr:hypothetical protein MSG28_009189 [Choristoneura fumiferana]
MNVDVTVTDNFGWREDSSGSEADAPHYPLDLRLAEARKRCCPSSGIIPELVSTAPTGREGGIAFLRRRPAAQSRFTLEERLAQEARERRMDDKRSTDDLRIKPSLSDELRVRSSLNDLRKSPDARRDPVHFVLGGDNVNWTGEDLPRAQSYSASQPQLRGARVPLPPPRRAPPPPAVARSRSTDIALEPELRRHPLAKQKPVPENSTSAEAPSPSSNTPEEESTDSSLMEDDGVPKPRKRRLHLPFGKKTKTPA